MERMKGVKIHETSGRHTHACLAPGQDQTRPSNKKKPGQGLSLGIRFRIQGQDGQDQQHQHQQVKPTLSCSCVQPLSTVQLLITVELGQGRCVRHDRKVGEPWKEYGGRGKGGQEQGVMVSLVSSSPATGGPMTNAALTPH